MVTLPHLELDDEEQEDSQMFRDALLNGDEKFNRFVKLTDSRFGSEARRTNKLRKETREGHAELRSEMQRLRNDLGPLIALADVLRFLYDLPWPLIGSVVGGAITVATILYGMGIRP